MGFARELAHEGLIEAARRRAAAPPAIGVERLDCTEEGSGFSTIPAPTASSSTDRCRSSVQERRSWTRTSTSPASIALPSRLSRKGDRRISGNTVKTSIRTRRG